MPIWIGLVPAGLSIIVIPFVVLLVRLAVKATRVEGKLDWLAVELKRRGEYTDKIQDAIVADIRADRAANDQRLRWLEQRYWQMNGKGSDAIRSPQG